MNANNNTSQSIILDVTELIENEYTDVFTIKSDEHGFLSPQSSVTFPIEFCSSVAGTFRDEYILIFDSGIPDVSSTSINQMLRILSIFVSR
jgi:hypothetical protein